MEIQKWEYKCVVNDWTDLKLDIEYQLDTLGADGWELVTVIGYVDHSDGYTKEKQKQTFYLKRPAQLPSDIVFTSDLKKTTEDNVPGGLA